MPTINVSVDPDRAFNFDDEDFKHVTVAGASSTATTPSRVGRRQVSSSRNAGESSMVRRRVMSIEHQASSHRSSRRTTGDRQTDGTVATAPVTVESSLRQQDSLRHGYVSNNITGSLSSGEGEDIHFDTTNMQNPEAERDYEEDSSHGMHAMIHQSSTSSTFGPAICHANEVHSMRTACSVTTVDMYQADEQSTCLHIRKQAFGGDSHNDSRCNFSVEPLSPVDKPDKKAFIIDEPRGSIVDKFMDTGDERSIKYKRVPRSLSMKRRCRIGDVNGDRLACDFSVEPMSPMSDISMMLKQNQDVHNIESNLFERLREKSFDAVQKMMDQYLPQQVEEMVLDSKLLPKNTNESVFGLLDEFLPPVGAKSSESSIGGDASSGSSSSTPLRFDNEYSLALYSSRAGPSGSSAEGEGEDTKTIAQNETFTGEEEVDEGSRVLLRLKSTATSTGDDDHEGGNNDDGQESVTSSTHTTVELVGPKFREWAPDQLEVVLVEKKQTMTTFSACSSNSNCIVACYEHSQTKSETGRDKNVKEHDNYAISSQGKPDKYALLDSGTSTTSAHSSGLHSLHSSCSSLPPINLTLSYDTEDDNPASSSSASTGNGSFSPLLNAKTMVPKDIEDTESLPHLQQPLQVWVARAPQPPILSRRVGTPTPKAGEHQREHQYNVLERRESVDDALLIRNVKSEELVSSRHHVRLLETIAKLIPETEESRDDITKRRSQAVNHVKKVDFWRSSVETLENLKGTQQSHRQLLTSLIAERNGAKATAETARCKLSQWTRKYQAQLQQKESEIKTLREQVDSNQKHRGCSNADQVERFILKVEEMSRQITCDGDSISNQRKPPNVNKPRLYQSEQTIHSEMMEIGKATYELTTREITTLEVKQTECESSESTKTDSLHISVQNACLGLHALTQPSGLMGDFHRTDSEIQSAIAKIVAQETIVLRRKIEGLQRDLAFEKATTETIKTDSSSSSYKRLQRDLESKSTQHDNLVLQFESARIQNIALEENVKTLENEAREVRASSKKALESQEKSLKYYKLRVVTLDDELSKLQEREKESSTAKSRALASSQEITSHLRSALSVAERERTLASSTLEELTIELQQTRQELKNADIENAELTITVETLTSANTECEATLLDMENEMQQLKTKAMKQEEDKEITISRCKEEIGRLTRQLTVIKDHEEESSNRAQEEINSLREQLAKTQREVFVLKQERRESNKKIDDALSNVTSMNTELASTRKALKRSNADKNKIALRLEKLAVSKKACDDKLADFEKRNAAAKNEARALMVGHQQATEGLQAHIKSLESDILSLKESERASSNQMRGTLMSSKELIVALRKEVAVLERARSVATTARDALALDLEKIRHQLETKALENKKLALKVEMLAAEQEGRGEAKAPLETSRHAASHHDDVERWSSEKEERLFMCQMHVATLEEEVLELRKALEEAFRAVEPKMTDRESFETIRAERDEALSQLEQKSRSHDVLTEMLDSTRSDLSRSIVEIARLTMELDNVHDRGRLAGEVLTGDSGTIAMLTNRIVNLERNLSTIAASQEAATNVFHPTGSCDNEACEQLEKIKHDLDVSQAGFKTFSGRFTYRMAENELLTKTLSELRRSQTVENEKKTTTATATMDIESVYETIASLQQQISEAESKRDYFQAKYNKENQDKKYLARCAEDLEKNVEQGMSNIAEMTAQMEELGAENEILVEKCSYFEDMLSDSRRMTEEKEKLIDCLKLDLSTLKDKLSEVEENLERYKFADEQRELLSDTLKTVEKELAAKSAESDRLHSELERVTQQKDEYSMMIEFHGLTLKKFRNGEEEQKLLMKTIDTLTENLKGKQAEVEELSSQLEQSSSEKAECAETIARLERDLKRGQATQHATDDVRELENALVLSQESEAKLIQTMTRSHERDRKEVLALRQQVSSLQSDILQIETNLEKALDEKNTLTDELEQTTCNLGRQTTEVDRLKFTLKQTLSSKETCKEETMYMKELLTELQLEKQFLEEGIKSLQDQLAKLQLEASTSDQAQPVFGDVEELSLRLEHAESMKEQYADEIRGLKRELVYLHEKTTSLQGALEKAQSDLDRRRFGGDDKSVMSASSTRDIQDFPKSPGFLSGGQPSSQAQIDTSSQRHRVDAAKLKELLSLAQQREADVARNASKKIHLLQHEITRLNDELQTNGSEKNKSDRVSEEARAEEMKKTKYSLECRASDVAHLSMMLELILSDKEKCEQRVLALEKSNTAYIRGLRSFLEQKNESLRQLNSGLSALMDELATLEQGVTSDDSGDVTAEMKIIEEDISQLRESEGIDRALRDEVEKKIELALMERRSLAFGLTCIRSESAYYKEHMPRVEKALAGFQGKVEAVLSRFGAGSPPSIDAVNDNKQLSGAIAQVSHELNVVLLYSEFQDRQELCVRTVSPNDSDEPFLVLESADRDLETNSSNKEVIKAVANSENRFFC